jgi:hypothetical protein
VRVFRNAAAMALVLVAVASLAALAVASRGGYSRGDSGTGQYGVKKECRVHAYGHGSQNRAGTWCPQGAHLGPR